MPADIVADLRGEVWRKLMNNASGNTLAALTRLGHYEIASDPDVKRLGMEIMRETLNVAAALGWDLRKEIDVEKIAGRATPGPSSPPSMLQDVLLGRPLEVEAHLGQTQAFAREARGVPMPTIDDPAAVTGLTAIVREASRSATLRASRLFRIRNCTRTLNPDVIPARGGNPGALGCCARMAQRFWIPAWRGDDDT